MSSGTHLYSTVVPGVCWDGGVLVVHLYSTGPWCMVGWWSTRGTFIQYRSLVYVGMVEYSWYIYTVPVPGVCWDGGVLVVNLYSTSTWCMLGCWCSSTGLLESSDT